MKNKGFRPLPDKTPNNGKCLLIDCNSLKLYLNQRHKEKMLELHVYMRKSRMVIYEKKI